MNDDDSSPRRTTLRRGTAAVLALAAFATVLRRLRRARQRTRDIPFSRLFARGRVGAAYLERRGVGVGDEVAGEMDDMGAYARPDFDPESVHPDVRRFYERTAEYDLAYTVTWHPGFRLGAALAGPITRRLEQLNLPGRSTDDPQRLESRFVALDDAADPREGVRAWIRTDPDSGEAVFVALYASHERGDHRYVNIAVPLPFSNLSTVLRVDALAPAGEESGLRLSTVGTGESGLYLVTPVGAFALPLDQSFRVWPAGAPDAPAIPEDESAEIVATHEMWLFGRQFVTITYTGSRSDPNGSVETQLG